MAVNLEELLRRSQLLRRELDAQGIYFLGDISDEEAESFGRAILLMAQQRAAAQATDSDITIYINSGGGSVGAGLAIIEMIYRVRHLFGVRVNTVVTGYAYSMGAVILQAGDKRSMGTFSTLMLHSPQWTLSGNDERIFSDFAGLANHYKQIISDLFAQRTCSHDPAWWQDYIYSGRDHFLTAEESLQLCLVDEIYDLEVAPGHHPAAPLTPPQQQQQGIMPAGKEKDTATSGEPQVITTDDNTTLGQDKPSSDAAEAHPS